MRLQTSSLRPVGLKRCHADTNGDAGAAIVAIRPIGKPAAAPETVANELAIDPAVDEMAWRRNLRPGHPVRKVAAGIGGRRVELQRRRRKVVELGHASTSVPGGSPQGTSGEAECTNAATSSANVRRGMGRAPNEARCAVCC